MPPTSINLTGSWPDSTGSVDIVRPMALILGGDTFPATEVRAVLDAAGSIFVPLHATDNPGVSPTGAYYNITERINGTVRSYNIIVPYNSAGATLDLNLVNPVVLGDPAYGTLSISDGIVTSAKIAAGAVTPDKLDRTYVESSYGLLAARPSPVTAPEESMYYATDVNGGTLYQNQTGVWKTLAAGVSERSGTELAWATNNQITTLGATVAPVDLVGGLSVTFTATARPVWVHWGGWIYHSVAGNTPQLSVYEGATRHGRVYHTSATATPDSCFVSRVQRLSLTPGAHTLKLMLEQFSAVATATVNGTVSEGATYLGVVEL